LALTSPTGCGRSVGTVRLRTKTTEFIEVISLGVPRFRLEREEDYSGWKSSVGIQTDYGVRFPTEARDCTPKRPDRLWGSTQPIQWTPVVLSPGVKRLEGEAEHSPPTNAEVKNGVAILPLPHTSSWHLIY
jgi:hypothetical protein